MKLIINKQIFEQLPGFQVSAMVLKNINNKKKISAVGQLLRGVCAQKRKEFKNEEQLKNFLNLLNKSKPGNASFHEVQLLESTIRKINRSKDIQDKNSVYALSYYFGLKNSSPFFALDLDQVEKDIEINYIVPKPGKRPDDIEFSKETQHAVFWVIDIGSQPKDAFEKISREATELVQKYCGGQIETYILNAENMEVDLGYESEKEKLYRERGPEMEISKEPSFISDEPVLILEKSLKDQICEILAEAVNSVLSEMGAEPEKIEIENPASSVNGDYSSNIAMKLAKKLQQNPQELAQNIKSRIPESDMLEKVEIAGPGFINFYLSESLLIKQLEKVLGQKSNFGRLGIGLGKKVIVEYSSPNIAKPLAVHHLLSTIIGQTLANMYKYAGYDTISMNWPGDWGTQFGKLIYAYKTWGNEDDVKKNPLNVLLELYVKFHAEEEKDPTLTDKGREEFKKLEEGDKENDKLWRWFRDVSIEELERIYKKLGVHFDEYLGERMYLEDARQLLQEGVEKGIVTEGEQGALIVKFDEDKLPPYMLQKANGTTLYATRDLASIKDRFERYKPDKIIYVVDIAQKLHFEQLFETAKKFGIAKGELVHAAFGRMQLPEGKMSTRKGDIILLNEVIREGIERATKLIEEKSQEMDAEDKAFIAEQMAISAIKYNIISQNRETNITFMWDKMLSLEGNSGPYLEYACARAQNILKKAKEMDEEKNKPLKNDKQTSLFSIEKAQQEDQEKDMQPFGHEKEKALLHLLPQFSEKIEVAVRDNKPNIITSYLFELAREFNSFYNEVPVISIHRTDLRDARLKLVQAVAQALQNGLKLLGIAVFERM